MIASVKSRLLYPSSPLRLQPWKLGFLRGASSPAERPGGFLELHEVEKVLSDVKADDVKVIPVRGLCDWTDFMVIATGRSTWHVRNIAQALIYKVKQNQKRAVQDENAQVLDIVNQKQLVLPSVEGHEGGNWIVIDYGTIIVHALEEKARAYYDLESLWTAEASPKVPNQDLAKAFVKIRPKNNSKKSPQKNA